MKGENHAMVPQDEHKVRHARVHAFFDRKEKNMASIREVREILRGLNLVGLKSLDVDIYEDDNLILIEIPLYNGFAGYIKVENVSGDDLRRQIAREALKKLDENYDEIFEKHREMAQILNI